MARFVIIYSSFRNIVFNWQKTVMEMQIVRVISVRSSTFGAKGVFLNWIKNSFVLIVLVDLKTTWAFMKKYENALRIGCFTKVAVQHCNFQWVRPSVCTQRTGRDWSTGKHSARVCGQCYWIDCQLSQSGECSDDICDSPSHRDPPSERVTWGTSCWLPPKDFLLKRHIHNTVTDVQTRTRTHTQLYKSK